MTYTNVRHLRSMTGRFITLTANKLLLYAKMHGTVARQQTRDRTVA